MNPFLSVLLAANGQTTAIPLPMICRLQSEESPGIEVLLNEHTALSLRGELIQDGQRLGTFQTGQTKGYVEVWWSFNDRHESSKGISVLFKDAQHWNPLRRQPRPSETNRMLFVGLASKLWSWSHPDQPGIFRGNRDLLNAAAGFWAISDSCLGGRIMKG